MLRVNIPCSTNVEGVLDEWSPIYVIYDLVGPI